MPQVAYKDDGDKPVKKAFLHFSSCQTYRNTHSDSVFCHGFQESASVTCRSWKWELDKLSAPVPDKEKPQRKPSINHDGSQANHGLAKPPVMYYGCVRHGYNRRFCSKCSQRREKAKENSRRGLYVSQGHQRDLKPIFRAERSRSHAIGSIGIQIASACGQSIILYKGPDVELANRQFVTIHGQVELPFGLLG
ncbi:hypothetical protein TSAR_011531 [Trichomalopsis sarcophagae]|uniref:Uncharacterized protein n=1 Tax=Trichomalopsis sarcophagae TaxID=543379 RepID=A0A232EQ09_9HYME|nr:hypothetical protein TSAR_011531 [Trichomalopsis sarcophagae]